MSMRSGSPQFAGGNRLVRRKEGWMREWRGGHQMG